MKKTLDEDQIELVEFCLKHIDRKQIAKSFKETFDSITDQYYDSIPKRLSKEQIRFIFITYNCQKHNNKKKYKRADVDSMLNRHYNALRG